MGYEVTAVTPLPYVNLGAVDSPPSDLCTQLSDCDEGTAVFDLTGSGDSFTFYDDTLTTLNVSTNGFIFGPDGLSGAACVACPQRLPTADEPNQLIAGLWRDADMSGGNGQWYGAVLVGLLSDPNDRVFYTNWHNAGQSGNPFLTGRYAIAMMLDGQSEPAGRIYMIFDHIADRATLIDVGYSIGVENRTGNNGVTYAFAPCHEAPCLSQAVTGAPPVNGTTLRFDPAIVAGPNSKLFTYQVQITGTVGDLLTNEVVVTSDGSVGLATAVTGTQVEYRRYFPIVSR